MSSAEAVDRITLLAVAVTPVVLVAGRIEPGGHRRCRAFGLRLLPVSVHPATGHLGPVLSAPTKSMVVPEMRCPAVATAAVCNLGVSRGDLGCSITPVLCRVGDRPILLTLAAPR